MVKGRVSICIPSRNERHLQRTIDSLLTHARGDIEVIAVLDGDAWPNPPLRNDPRLIVVRHNEPRGMRPTINEAAQIASGEFYMKCDAHCMFADGYDEILKADCDDQTLAVPTRHSIDGADWTMKPRNWNYSILTYPFLVSQYGVGLHAVTFDQKENRTINTENMSVQVDDLLSFQGSCWIQHRATFLADGPLDHDRFYFYSESQETGLLRYWLRGRRCVVNKRTWYAHYHKGNNNLHTVDGRIGRGFFLNVHKKRKCEAEVADICVNNTWPGATRTFDSLVEQFWPLISRMKDPKYAWPLDWYDWNKYRTEFENRPTEQVPEHI